MARERVSYLSIIDPVSNAVIRRWQRGYVNQTVTWDGAEWSYLPMEPDGVATGDPANISVVVKLPAIKDVFQPFEQAMIRGWHIKLDQYDFDIFDGQTTPPADQLPTSTHRGELERMRSPDWTKLEIEIGSVVARSDTKLLPLVLTTASVGAPIQY